VSPRLENQFANHRQEENTKAFLTQRQLAASWVAIVFHEHWQSSRLVEVVEIGGLVAENTAADG